MLNDVTSCVTGQHVQLGLCDAGLDLGLLFLWLHPDSDPWWLPRLPHWAQVAAGFWRPRNRGVHTAHTCCRRPGCQLPHRRQGSGRDRRGELLSRADRLHVDCQDCDKAFVSRESRILPSTPCGRRGRPLWRGADCSLYPTLVRLTEC